MLSQEKPRVSSGIFCESTPCDPTPEDRTEVDGRSRALRVGELVEVRSVEEIMATLDEHGSLEGMPFMPEMFAFCGQRFRVLKSAHKTCDRAGGGNIMSVSGAVHLEGVRCDGSAHDGCEAGCRIFWKEAWLKPVQPRDSESLPATVIARQSICKIDKLKHRVRSTTADGRQRYSCQATEQLKFSTHLPWWDLRQYTRDFLSGNASLRLMLWSFLVFLFNRIQRYRGGSRFPDTHGTQTKSPKQLLDLQPGELVQIKSMDEIHQTLHVDEHNRGLTFDKEMVKFCGRQARVLRRVDKIIDEKTGQMIRLKGDCIILEGVACDGDYRRFCPRGIYPYWREIWLTRVEQRDLHTIAGVDGRAVVGTQG